VDLDIEEITLVQSPHEQDAWYLFDCWGCAEQVVKPAPSSIALALGSVHARTWTVPAEALERPAAESAPPIDVDDLLDVLLALSCDVPIGCRRGGYSQSGRSGKSARPSECSLTPSTWCSWIWLRSNPSREPAR